MSGKKDSFRIPAATRLPLFFALLWNAAVYNGSRLLTSGTYHYHLESAIDRRIPVLPWTVSVYLGCYLFWAVNYCLVLSRPDDGAWKLLGADFLAKLVCLICFLVFPTAIVRPDMSGGSFWRVLLRLVYRLDAADNLFPSIHCLVSWLSFLAVRKDPRIPPLYQGFSFLFCMLVCVSTLTTKQHVLVDTVSGVLLAEGSYRFVCASGFYRFWRKLFCRGRCGREEGEQ